MIRMLSGHLGVQTFLDGVSLYLKKHSYGNATTNDLWSALSTASGKDISHFMNPWIQKIGVRTQAVPRPVLSPPVISLSWS